MIRPARPEDAEHIAVAHVRSWRESYPGLIPQETLDGLSVERRTAQWHNTLGLADRHTFVADIDGAVCGFVSGGPIKWSGLKTASEVSALYLIESAKRRGLGRALFQAELEALAARGFASAGLWVLTDNAPARRFYEAMGGRAAENRVDPMGGLSLNEIAYVWDDLTAHR